MYTCVCICIYFIFTGRLEKEVAFRPPCLSESDCFAYVYIYIYTQIHICIHIHIYYTHGSLRQISRFPTALPTTACLCAPLGLGPANTPVFMCIHTRTHIHTHTHTNTYIYVFQICICTCYVCTAPSSLSMPTHLFLCAYT